MDIEKFTEAANRLTEAMNALGVQLVEAANAIGEMFRAIFSMSDNQPNNNVVPKKQRKPFPRCPRKLTANYSYIPRAPRHRPYQRRTY